MDATAPTSSTGRSAAGRRDTVTSFGLSYLLGALLLAALVHFGGVWEVLANTRFLDVLIRVGVIKYHDQNLGFVDGVADHQYYLKSQTPVDWPLVAVAAGIFLAFWGIKTLQFHGLARFFGARGSFGHQARAYLYGLGINRLFPLGLGDVGTVKVLEGQGFERRPGTSAVFTAEAFVLFEIAVFALVGLLSRGWMPWAAQMFWPVVIFGLTALWLCGLPGRPGLARGRAWLREAGDALRSLSTDPRLLGKLALLSIAAFALEDLAAYVIANAFGIGIPFTVLLMGVVGSYIARLIPLTPGGIGQFEWGFATALWLGGVGFPDAVTVAILDNAIRYLTGSFTLGSVLLWYGVETDLPAVLDAYAEAPAEATA